MKKIFLCLLLFITIGLTSCGNPDIRTGKVSSEHPYKDEITVMHIEAENDDFRNYIDEASHKLNIKINLIPCPSDANNRQAEVATILASGNTAIDLISVNDEMVSEFKYKGYLEPLNDVKRNSASIPNRLYTINSHLQRKYFFRTLSDGYYDAVGKRKILKGLGT